MKKKLRLKLASERRHLESVVRMMNQYPKRFMDAAETQPVHFGDPRWETAPYEEVIVLHDAPALTR